MSFSVVMDTCILVSALRSNQGASYKLLSLIDNKKIKLNLSVPLVLEYESAAKRMVDELKLTNLDIDDIIDYLCKIGKHHQVHYLWRPNLNDPGDDFILELAVEANCDYIITHNIRDFTGSEKFSIKVISPREFLKVIGEIL
ncbi:MAG: putative toxin-antitoxin system toxin component, PIN family [Spirochaetia bacterium]|nr:putative toxin-antitoxin system toxin component, PIN family [Spirochaetia bacterium]